MKMKTALCAVGIAGLIAFGCQGPKGDTGTAGATGPAGSQGTQGTQGPQGPAGNLTSVPVTGTVIFSLGGADREFANPETGSLFSYFVPTATTIRLGDTGYPETNALAVNASTKTLYVGQGIRMGGRILKVDLTTGSVTPLGKIGVRQGVLGLTFSPNGQLIAVAANCCFANRALISVDTTTGQGTLLGTPLNGTVYGIGFSPNGTLLGFNWGTLRSINTTTGAVTNYPGPQACNNARGLAFRTATEIIGGDGGCTSVPMLYRLNLTTGVCTTINLGLLTSPGCSGMGVAIAP